MLHRKTILAVVLVSFCLAVCCGFQDQETESIVHLFTAEIGNLVALVIFTAIFSAIGLVAVFGFSKINSI